MQDKKVMEFETFSPEETLELGRKFGKRGTAWGGIYPCRGSGSRQDGFYTGNRTGTWN